MSDDSYRDKQERLQKYVPFLNRVIDTLTKKTNDSSKDLHLTKIKSLLDLLTNKNKRVNIKFLIKSEKALESLHKKYNANLNRLLANKPINKPSISQEASFKAENNVKVESNALEDDKNLKKECVNTNQTVTKSTCSKDLMNTEKDRYSINTSLDTVVAKKAETPMSIVDKSEQPENCQKKYSSYDINKKDFNTQHNSMENVDPPKKFLCPSEANIDIMIVSSDDDDVIIVTPPKTDQQLIPASVCSGIKNNEQKSIPKKVDIIKIEDLSDISDDENFEKEVINSSRRQDDDRHKHSRKKHRKEKKSRSRSKEKHSRNRHKSHYREKSKERDSKSGKSVKNYTESSSRSKEKCLETSKRSFKTIPLNVLSRKSSNIDGKVNVFNKHVQDVASPKAEKSRTVLLGSSTISSNNKNFDNLSVNINKNNRIEGHKTDLKSSSPNIDFYAGHKYFVNNDTIKPKGSLKVQSTKTSKTNTTENYQMSSEKPLNSINENNGTLIGKNESNGCDFNMNLLGVNEGQIDSKCKTLDQTQSEGVTGRTGFNVDVEKGLKEILFDRVDSDESLPGYGTLEGCPWATISELIKNEEHLLCSTVNDDSIFVNIEYNPPSFAEEVCIETTENESGVTVNADQNSKKNQSKIMKDLQQKQSTVKIRDENGNSVSLKENELNKPTSKTSDSKKNVAKESFLQKDRKEKEIKKHSSKDAGFKTEKKSSKKKKDRHTKHSERHSVEGHKINKDRSNQPSNEKSSSKSKNKSHIKHNSSNDIVPTVTPQHKTQTKCSNVSIELGKDISSNHKRKSEKSSKVKHTQSNLENPPDTKEAKNQKKHPNLKLKESKIKVTNKEDNLKVDKSKQSNHLENKSQKTTETELVIHTKSISKSDKNSHKKREKITDSGQSSNNVTIGKSSEHTNVSQVGSIEERRKSQKPIENLCQQKEINLESSSSIPKPILTKEQINQCLKEIKKKDMSKPIPDEELSKNDVARNEKVPQAPKNPKKQDTNNLCNEVKKLHEDIRENMGDDIFASFGFHTSCINVTQVDSTKKRRKSQKPIENLCHQKERNLESSNSIPKPILTKERNIDQCFKEIKKTDLSKPMPDEELSKNDVARNEKVPHSSKNPKKHATNNLCNEVKKLHEDIRENMGDVIFASFGFHTSSINVTQVDSIKERRKSQKPIESLCHQKERNLESSSSIPKPTITKERNIHQSLKEIKKTDMSKPIPDEDLSKNDVARNEKVPQTPKNAKKHATNNLCNEFKKLHENSEIMGEDMFTSFELHTSSINVTQVGSIKERRKSQKPIESLCHQKERNLESSSSIPKIKKDMSKPIPDEELSKNDVAQSEKVPQAPKNPKKHTTNHLCNELKKLHEDIRENMDDDIFMSFGRRTSSINAELKTRNQILQDDNGSSKDDESPEKQKVDRRPATAIKRTKSMISEDPTYICKHEGETKKKKDKHEICCEPIQTGRKSQICLTRDDLYLGSKNPEGSNLLSIETASQREIKPNKISKRRQSMYCLSELQLSKHRKIQNRAMEDYTLPTDWKNDSKLAYFHSLNLKENVTAQKSKTLSERNTNIGDDADPKMLASPGDTETMENDKRITPKICLKRNSTNPFNWTSTFSDNESNCAIYQQLEKYGIQECEVALIRLGEDDIIKYTERNCKETEPSNGLAESTSDVIAQPPSLTEDPSLLGSSTNQPEVVPAINKLLSVVTIETESDITNHSSNKSVIQPEVIPAINKLLPEENLESESDIADQAGKHTPVNTECVENPSNDVKPVFCVPVEVIVSPMRNNVISGHIHILQTKVGFAAQPTMGQEVFDLSPITESETNNIMMQEVLSNPPDTTQALDEGNLLIAESADATQVATEVAENVNFDNDSTGPGCERNACQEDLIVGVGTPLETIQDLVSSVIETCLGPTGKTRGTFETTNQVSTSVRKENSPELLEQNVISSTTNNDTSCADAKSIPPKIGSGIGKIQGIRRKISAYRRNSMYINNNSSYQTPLTNNKINPPPPMTSTAPTIYQIISTGYSFLSPSEQSFHCLVQNCQFVKTRIIDELEKHFIMQHGDIKSSSPCKTCGRLLSTDSNIFGISDEIKHIKTHHNSCIFIRKDLNSSTTDTTNAHVQSGEMPANRPKETSCNNSTAVVTSDVDHNEGRVSTTVNPSTKPPVLAILKPWTNKSKSNKSIDECIVMLRKREIVNTFKCMGDNCIYSTPLMDSMYQHLNWHQEGSRSPHIGNGFSWLECAYCDSVSIDYKDLLQHVILAHSRCDFQCMKCFYRGQSAEDLCNHVGAYHYSPRFCDLSHTRQESETVRAAPIQCRRATVCAPLAPFEENRNVAENSISRAPLSATESSYPSQIMQEPRYHQAGAQIWDSQQSAARTDPRGMAPAGVYPEQQPAVMLREPQQPIHHQEQLRTHQIGSVNNTMSTGHQNFAENHYTVLHKPNAAWSGNNLQNAYNPTVVEQTSHAPMAVTSNINYNVNSPHTNNVFSNPVRPAMQLPQTGMNSTHMDNQMLYNTLMNHSENTWGRESQTNKGSPHQTDASGASQVTHTVKPTRISPSAASTLHSYMTSRTTASDTSIHGPQTHLPSSMPISDVPRRESQMHSTPRVSPPGQLNQGGGGNIPILMNHSENAWNKEAQANSWNPYQTERLSTSQVTDTVKPTRISPSATSTLHSHLASRTTAIDTSIHGQQTQSPSIMPISDAQRHGSHMHHDPRVSSHLASRTAAPDTSIHGPQIPQASNMPISDASRRTSHIQSSLLEQGGCAASNITNSPARPIAHERPSQSGYQYSWHRPMQELPPLYNSNTRSDNQPSYSNPWPNNNSSTTSQPMRRAHRCYTVDSPIETPHVRPSNQILQKTRQSDIYHPNKSAGPTSQLGQLLTNNHLPQNVSSFNSNSNLSSERLHPVNNQLTLDLRVNDSNLDSNGRPDSNIHNPESSRSVQWTTQPSLTENPASNSIANTNSNIPLITSSISPTRPDQTPPINISVFFDNPSSTTQNETGLICVVENGPGQQSTVNAQQTNSSMPVNSPIGDVQMNQQQGNVHNWEPNAPNTQENQNSSNLPLLSSPNNGKENIEQRESYHQGLSAEKLKELLHKKSMSFIREDLLLTCPRKECQEPNFDDAESLNIHLSVQHPKQKSHICKFCNTRTPNFVDHLLFHSKVIYSCCECNFLHHSYKHVGYHTYCIHSDRQHQMLIISRGNEIKSELFNFLNYKEEEFWKCYICEKVTDSSYAHVANHIAVNHPTVAYDCRHCYYSAKQKSALEKHHKSYHAHEAFEFNLSKPRPIVNFKNTAFATALETRVVKLHSVSQKDICSRPAVNSNSFLTCRHCLAYYSKLEHMMSHWRNEHSPSVPFQFSISKKFTCNYCTLNASFDYLKDHHSKMHSTVPFKIGDATFNIEDTNLSLSSVDVVTQLLLDQLREGISSVSQKCVKCNIIFKEDEFIRRHVEQDHNNGNVPIVKYTEKCILFGCNLCQIFHNDEINIIKHIIEHIQTNQSELSSATTENYIDFYKLNCVVLFENGLILRKDELISTKYGSTKNFCNLMNIPHETERGY